MTRYLYATDFLVPAGTPIAVPNIAPVPLDNRILDSVRVIIPPGHNGLTGFSVRDSAVNIVPYVQGTWLVGNDEIVDFAYNGEVTAGGLQAYGYNLDIFDHTFHLRWILSDLAGPSPVAIESPQAGTVFAAAPSAIVSTLTGSLDQAAVDQLTEPDTAGVADLTGAVAP